MSSELERQRRGILLFAPILEKELAEFERLVREDERRVIREDPANTLYGKSLIEISRLIREDEQCKHLPILREP